MKMLDPKKLYVQYRPNANPADPKYPRRYTLTHSDTTAQLFLVAGPEFAYDTTNEMRDEVFAEWKTFNREKILYGYVLIADENTSKSQAKTRNEIFMRELPRVLEAFFYGDRFFFQAHPEYKDAPVYIQFESVYPEYRQVKSYGPISKYQ
ncbi:staygreen family protein [Fictibacillus sp. KIGAM418]|uniref:Staygreen family protein n=1 Tax=Fictibacillus marinisediminis TaxID=2878389 RepID=A0A9X1XEH0_9BACL|nr:staygreen family protein [Fictibacillus marinisediminis]MCK6259309.1 staygreen family protein [Fictibacillus marinisediminis]